MKPYTPNFSGKLLSIISNGEDTPILLAEARFEEQFGRLFLIGVVPPGGSRRDWLEGMTSAVAWDTVQEYMVYDSVADYVTRLDIYKGRKKRSER